MHEPDSDRDIHPDSNISRALLRFKTALIISG
jgi:hypothetical protein